MVRQQTPFRFMTDFSKNRLMTGQSCFKKQDNLSEGVDFFTFT